MHMWVVTGWRDRRAHGIVWVTAGFPRMMRVLTGSGRDARDWGTFEIIKGMFSW